MFGETYLGTGGAMLTVAEAAGAEDCGEIENLYEVDLTISHKKSDPYISLVVPVYNEQGNLADLYAQVKVVLDKLGKSYEIIFVDDGSRDSSYEILKNIAQDDRTISVIRFAGNFGQTAAMAAGFNHARGEIIVTIDADLQNDPEDIPVLLDKIEEGADVASGWRKNRQDAVLSRKIPSWCANRLVSKFGGVRLHDFGCTLKAYRAKNIKRISLYGEVHRFLPALLKREGAEVVEVPVRHHPRTRGVSKYGLERIFKVFLDLFLLKFISGYATRPLHFFGFFALILMGLGCITGTITVYERYVVGFSGLNLLPLLMLTMLFLVMGANTILIGLLGEIGIRTYYESQNKKPYVVDHVLDGKDC